MATLKGQLAEIARANGFEDFDAMQKDWVKTLIRSYEIAKAVKDKEAELDAEG